MLDRARDASPPLDRQVVVVVGATSGIGRAAALRFAERGARLVVTARDLDALGRLADELRTRGSPAVETVAGDVVDPGHLLDVVDRATSRFGRLDTWAHVAGVDVFATVADTTPDEFRRVIEVNLLGPAYGAKAAVPALRASGGGAFIAVSSVEADVPLPFQAAYSASKHGLSAFLRSLRMELEGDGVPVRVTQIQPYGIDTPLFRVARARMDGPPRPASPVYAPEVVAELIVHAAEHPARELFAGGAGWLTAMAQRIAPHLSEAVLSRIAERMQAGETPPPPPGLPASGEADNLFSPVPGVESTTGGYGGRRFSVGNRVQMASPAARAAVLLAIAGLGSLAIRRAH
jgi:NAD(P)-dependent dehydrogenase (short-subunit alcohol dehydrogenase family)